MSNLQVLEGTWEELKLNEKELSGRRFRLIPLPMERKKTPPQAESLQIPPSHEPEAKEMRPLTGMGKFAGLLPSSEEFMHQKQAEIELEDRKFHR